MIYTLYLVDDNNNVTETISLDVISSFGEDYSSNIAQNSVENGYVISDSISLSNPKFNISGVITDTKFRVRGQLVVFDGNTFVKVSGGNKEQVTQISDDEFAETVKARLLKLWENKEIFGILESKDINNIKGTQVRSVFPCALSNLSFEKSDAASAIYPRMSIEKIRYAVVTFTTVKNPTPELLPKYQESISAQSKSSTSSASTGADSVSSDLKDANAQAKSVVENATQGTGGNTEVVKKDNLINLNRTAQGRAQAWFNSLGEAGRKLKIAEYGSEYAAKAFHGSQVFAALLQANGYSKGAATYEPR